MINMKKKVGDFLDAPLTIRRELKMATALYGALALAWVAGLLYARKQNKKEEKVKVYDITDWNDFDF